MKYKTKKSLLTLSLILMGTLTAQADKHEHRHHGKHVHGEGKLAIALENDSEAHVQFEFPGDAVFGFEHTPKNDKQKQTVEAALKTLETEFAQMLILDAALGCTFKKEKLEIKTEGKHNSVEGEFEIECKNSLKDQKIRFGFNKKFPKLKKLDVDILKDDAQKSQEINRDKGEIKL